MVDGLKHNMMYKPENMSEGEFAKDVEKARNTMTKEMKEQSEERAYVEDVHSHEWMAKEMFDEIKKQGFNNPQDVHFSSGFHKDHEGNRLPFFDVNFKQKGKWYRGGIDGKSVVISESGDVAKEGEE